MIEVGRYVKSAVGKYGGFDHHEWNNVFRGWAELD